MGFQGAGMIRCQPCGAVENAVSPNGERMSEEGVDMELEEEYGMRVPRKMQDPKLPSREEVEDHCKTHLPYRSWCRHCVMGKGTVEACRKIDEELTMNEFHMDFLFLEMRRNCRR